MAFALYEIVILLLLLVLLAATSNTSIPSCFSSRAAMAFAMKWYNLVQIYIFALKVLFCENTEAAAATILATYATIFAFCRSNIHRANLVM